MSTIPPREYLTSLLMLRLVADLPAPILAGDGIAPPEAGWQGGQPGAPGTEFVPYVVLKALTATAPGRQPVGDEDQAWIFPYTLTGWGTLRAQADYAADQGSAVIDAIPKIKAADLPGFGGFGVQLVQVSAIGTTERSDQTAPQLWYRGDTIQVRVARARGA